MLSFRVEEGFPVADEKEEKLQNRKFINEAISSLTSLYLLSKIIESERAMTSIEKNIGLGMIEHQTAEQDSAHGNKGKILLLVEAEREAVIVKEKGI